ncbi:MULTISPECIES: biotin transporter BioY [Bacillaceae]|uniref:Biotin transporter n=1 Tax=Peribacillus huizhouensis TaxID=1501239 RepID=A0ABR6CTI5_9BACI|nr:MULTISPECIES: biotin transporter BioY [Bacillaceae]MBA9027657.1 biotin transport system substrate-specific component [Peribacillus huizhouensis]
MRTNSQTRLINLIIIALFSAIIGIFSQVMIPIPPVPFTGQTLAVGLAATILGAKRGTYSVLLYLLLGAVGIPVFAEMTSGISRIVGPTGGYLIGFIPAAFFVGFYLEKTKFTVFHAIIANIISMFFPLLIGTAWLKVAASLSWTAAFVGGFFPFILVGIAKAILAGWLGILLRSRLESAKVLPKSTTA